jgi:hypothetical protein
MGRKIIFRTALTDTQIWTANQTVPQEQIGTIREENNLVYKFVAFSGATTIAAGDALCYVAAASDGSAVLCDGANTALGAGIAMAAVASGTIASGATYYATGWVQIKGLNTALSTTVSGSPAIGYPLTCQGASNATLAALSTTAATMATQMVVGYFYKAKAALLDYPY